MKLCSPIALLVCCLGIASCGGGSKPPGLTGSNTQSGVLLSWSASDGDDAAVGYWIYREDGVSGFAKVNDVAVTATWFTDSTVDSGTYTYEVTAVDASGVESGPSNQVTISVP